MKFLANGDYIFPLHFPLYWAEYAYTWSYTRGAPNPDGIIRLPGRLADVLVFALAGNIAFGYFYVALCLSVAFLAFVWFSGAFLDVRPWGVRLLGGLFFALNPIFLGNLSKVGLVLAVAMLPVALTALKRGFESGRFSYFLLVIVALNVSLIHPFTFLVNLLVCVAYLIYLVLKHKPFVRDNLHKFALIAGSALLLNAYIILPLLALGTLDKGEISDGVNSAPVDYTALVDVANTGDIFTALSLSKGVLKDYEFYGAATWPFYFLGVFGLYILLLGTYVYVEKRLKPVDRRRIIIALAVFLLLLALSTASYLGAGEIIKWVIGLPGGWTFRSPLKWQLYIPLALFAVMVLTLKYVTGKNARRLLYAAFGAVFLLMNGYLFAQIYERLLTPRTFTHFQALKQTELAGKNLLLVSSTECLSLARDNPRLATELNQVLISKNVQVKSASSAGLDGINLAQYDFLLGCTGTMGENALTGQYRFVLENQFAGGTYSLYRNTEPQPYAAAVPGVFELEPQNLAGKSAFAREYLDQPLNFVDSGEAGHPSTSLQAIFEDLSPASIQEGALQAELRPLHPQNQKLFVTNGQALHVLGQDDGIQVSTDALEGAPEPITSEVLPLEIPHEGSLKMTYRDPAFSLENIMPNPSFEDDLWQAEVGDCNAYDDQPDLYMALDQQHTTDGSRSLLLEARRHIACTGPNPIPVEAGHQYLLSFDYRTNGNHAGFFAGFDNDSQTSVSERLSGEGQWQQFTRTLAVPAGAEHLDLLVYGYPDAAAGETGRANYDNFSLIKIPDVQNRFFVVSGDNETMGAPTLNSTKVNPTKHLLHVQDAHDPFYVSTKESYHRLWSLSGVPPGNHLLMNGGMNGWYIDPQELCRNGSNTCTANADGSYDIELVMQFTPQRWFRIGAVISLLTVAGAVAFVVIDIRTARQAARRAR